MSSLNLFFPTVEKQWHPTQVTGWSVFFFFCCCCCLFFKVLSVLLSFFFTSPFFSCSQAVKTPNTFISLLFDGALEFTLPVKDEKRSYPFFSILQRLTIRNDKITCWRSFSVNVVANFVALIFAPKVPRLMCLCLTTRLFHWPWCACFFFFLLSSTTYSKQSTHFFVLVSISLHNEVVAPRQAVAPR